MMKNNVMAEMMRQVNEMRHWHSFLSLSDLIKLDDAEQVLVDSALVCSRLQILKNTDDNTETSDLVHEIEVALYKTESIQVSKSSKKSRLRENRVCMSVGEVRTFFGVLESISPLAIMGCRDVNRKLKK